MEAPVTRLDVRPPTRGHVPARVRTLSVLLIATAMASVAAPFAIAQDYRPLVPCRDADLVDASYFDGVLDLYTALLCLAGDRRCGCLSAMETPELDAALLDACVRERGDDALFGVVTGSSEIACQNAAAAPLNGTALLSCRRFADLPDVARAAYPLGVLDFLSGLHCFVGDRRCACLQELGRRGNIEMSNRVGDDLAACLERNEDEAAIGVVLRAADGLCAGVCGDGFADLDLGEDCDGDDFGGASCASLGFDFGGLSCREDCTIDAGDCRQAPSCIALDASCGDASSNCCAGRCCGFRPLGGPLEGRCEICSSAGEPCTTDEDCCVTGRPGEVDICSGGICEIFGFANGGFVCIGPDG